MRKGREKMEVTVYYTNYCTTYYIVLYNIVCLSIVLVLYWYNIYTYAYCDYIENVLNIGDYNYFVKCETIVYIYSYIKKEI